MARASVERQSDTGATMGMTIVEKILSRAQGGAPVKPGDLVTVAVDRMVMLDTTFFFLNQMRREILHVPYPDRVVLVFDHEVPAPSIISATAQMAGRAFAAKWGIHRFHDLGRDQGISHVLVSERAHAMPGMLLIGSDSHSLSVGVMNCAARAVTILDLLQAVTTGKTWLIIGETVRYDFVGALGAGVSAMDVFLMMAGRYGSHAGMNIEYGGAGLSALSIESRRTISTMSAELNADFATFEADAILRNHVVTRTDEPFGTVTADPDAHYIARHVIDLAAIETMVALPDQVLGNTVPVGALAGERIQQAFIGSCANGSLTDIRAAAAVVAGRRVAPGVRLIVTPGSPQIYREAMRAGYLETLSEAGAIVTNSTCGACAGGHLGVLGPREACITTSTRNFRGRMGDASARIYMGSPATVAASAVAGSIVHPGGFLERPV